MITIGMAVPIADRRRLERVILFKLIIERFGIEGFRLELRVCPELGLGLRRHDGWRALLRLNLAP